MVNYELWIMFIMMIRYVYSVPVMYVIWPFTVNLEPINNNNNNNNKLIVTKDKMTYLPGTCVAAHSWRMQPRTCWISTEEVGLEERGYVFMNMQGVICIKTIDNDILHVLNFYIIPKTMILLHWSRQNLILWMFIFDFSLKAFLIAKTML